MRTKPTTTKPARKPVPRLSTFDLAQHLERVRLNRYEDADADGLIDGFIAEYRRLRSDEQAEFYAGRNVLSVIESEFDEAEYAKETAAHRANRELPEGMERFNIAMTIPSDGAFSSGGSFIWEIARLSGQGGARRVMKAISALLDFFNLPACLRELPPADRIDDQDERYYGMSRAREVFAPALPELPEPDGKRGAA